MDEIINELVQSELAQEVVISQESLDLLNEMFGVFFGSLEFCIVAVGLMIVGGLCAVVLFEFFRG